MTDKLETIKQACWKANPEILELKFGCEVRHESGEVWIATSYPDKDGSIFADNLKGQVSTILAVYEYQEILGRPIRLADILLVMHEKLGGGYFVGSDAGFYRTWIEWDEKDLNKKGEYRHEGMGGVGVQWNLRKDSLEDQSPETIDFLYELLN